MAFEDAGLRLAWEGLALDRNGGLEVGMMG